MGAERIELITGVERRRRWSVTEKLRLVAATREPGMSVAAVARQHGLSESLLYNWRSRVERGELVDPTGAVDTGFVPVAVMDARAMARVPPWQAPTLSSPGMIEIELPNGCRLRVSERVAVSTLRRLIGVLGAVRRAC